jgi:hypothetical protein
MKHQEHKFDSAVVGLNDLYIETSEGDYYVNAKKIMVAEKTIRTGRTYLLVDSSNDNAVKVYSVVLVDVYCQDNVIYMIVQDLITQRIFNVDYFIDDGEIKGLYMLIDMDFFIQMLKGYQNGNN